MDETNISDEIDDSNKSGNSENKTEHSAVLSEEPYVSNENQLSCVELLPALKQISIERKEKPDRHLEKYKNESLNKKITDVFPEINMDENAKGTKEKKGNIRNTVSKYLSRALTNPTGAIRNIKHIWKKGKKPKDLRSKSCEILAEGEKCDFQTEDPKIVLTERPKSHSQLEGLEDSKTRITNIGKRKMKQDVFEKLVMQSETSIKTKAVPLRSTNSTLEYKTQYDSDAKTQSAKVRSTEEVKEHFRCFMESNRKTLNRVKTSDINKKDAQFFSEHRIRKFHDPMKLACQELEDSVKIASNPAIRTNIESVAQSSKEKSGDEVMNHFRCFMQSKTKTLNRVESGSINKGDTKFSEPRIRKFHAPIKLENELARQELENSVRTDSNTAVRSNLDIVKTQADNSAATPKSIPRQRIVYDERSEHIRGWIIQQIKDREILLKFRIMEGKYSEDIETKMRCIEEAEDLQEETDAFFDALDDYDKMANLPKRCKRYSDSVQDIFSISPTTKKKKDLNWPEGQIKSFLNLFSYLYKFSNSEYNNENIFERINLDRFMIAYEIYLIYKEKQDRESKISENNARNAIDKFYLSLIQVRSKVKWKSAHTDKRASEYQKYIHLQIAARQNLISLQTLLPQVTSVILPLMSYLSQSRKKFVNIFAFLNEEKPDVFLETKAKYADFFEKFCSNHFKN